MEKTAVYVNLNFSHEAKNVSYILPHGVAMYTFFLYLVTCVMS